MTNKRIRGDFRRRAVLVLMGLMALAAASSAAGAYDPDRGLAAARQRERAERRRIAEALRDAPGRQADPAAVAEVLAGRRDLANAAWWGFDAEDATACLQAAIDSGATTLVVPDMGRPWVIHQPLQLVNDQAILFERGVEILAARGAFRGIGDCLFNAICVNDIELIGYGATLRMRRLDYQGEDYDPFESRHLLQVIGCEDVTIRGLTFAESGGDGILLSDYRHPRRDGRVINDRRIVIQDVTCRGNHRQGISICSVVGLLVENCRFVNTRGVPPSDGIDIEPFSAPGRTLVDVVIRDCEILRNAGGGVTINRGRMPAIPPVSVRLENCRIGHSQQIPVVITSVGDAEPQPEGLIELVDCLIENSPRSGVVVTHKSALSTRVRLVRCTLRNVASDWDSAEDRRPWVDREHDPAAWEGRPIWPIYLYAPHEQVTTNFGGIEFVDCLVIDDRDRPVLWFEENGTAHGLTDVHGTIRVDSPHPPRVHLGENTEDVDIRVLPASE